MHRQIIRKGVEIQQYANNINREDGFPLSRSRKHLIQFPKEKWQQVDSSMDKAVSI